MPSLIQRILAPSRRAAEGAVRPGPYRITTGNQTGWLPDGAPINWWQTGMDPLSSSRSAIVEACVSAYARTIAMCPGAHWRKGDDGGRERVTNSALARILQRPNDYQTISDFMLTAVRDLYSDCNAYALALRNARFEVDELHLMRATMCRPVVAEDGSIFYQLAGNDVISRMLGGQYLLVPQRDTLHIRLTPSESRVPYPLIGESPLIAAALDMATSGAISQQTLQFMLNQARPSAVLSTDLQLSREQAEDLRQRWDEQSRALNQGRTPILSAGLKVLPWTTGGRDAQIAELLKMSDQHVAMAFGVPLAVIGLADNRYANVEALMTAWRSSGLGFAIGHVEAAFDRLFDLDGAPREYVEFDTEILLRSAYRDRIDGLTRAISGGLLSPNEARALEGLAPAEYGDEPRLQAQVVPLSAAGKIQPAEAATAAPVEQRRALTEADHRRGAENILALADRLEQKRR